MSDYAADNDVVADAQTKSKLENHEEGSHAHDDSTDMPSGRRFAAKSLTKTSSGLSVRDRWEFAK